MEVVRNERLTEAELHAFFDRLFPHGFAGADVLVEVAPEGWEQSALLTCFHPSAERVFDESVQLHRNIGALRNARPRQDIARQTDETLFSEPTLEEVRRDYRPTPVQPPEELTELVGLCLWDVFSDNHDVIAADGRAVDIGSFRGAGAFLDEHLAAKRDAWDEGDYLRFYLGTIWIGARADCAPVYAMIFRRLKALGADWVYHFPELALVDLGGLRDEDSSPTRYSPNEALAAERAAREREAELARFRTDLNEINARAREEAMDRPLPATVRAYRQVCGRDPRGWPPA
ncbi:MAG: hypothetical protein A3G76_06580 [Acidobacteria bacterium RIFCSPLOWO2_12_FULL_65_11]|nr:MAG: hypothetical protein A3H95_02640 [Acidobacteria bacterium RIFCSPLOWO2_02_FULL_64_15]OFW31097.1 MAG: hypothetical protein A3G76_06580 [Acidobacteria bacterium RIFCSPLOWO2_12_FULL_65_11]